MNMEQTESSETSAYKLQMSGNYPEEGMQHSEHGESLKSRILLLVFKNAMAVYFGPYSRHFQAIITVK